MIKVFRSDNNMITEAYLVNTAPEDISVVYNGNTYEIPANEIVLTDGGVAQIMLDQTLRYDSLTGGVYENPRYGLKAFTTLKEAEEYVKELGTPAQKPVEQQEVSEQKEEKKPLSKLNKSELIALIKEQYNVEFTEEGSTRDELLQFIKNQG